MIDTHVFNIDIKANYKADYQQIRVEEEWDWILNDTQDSIIFQRYIIDTIPEFLEIRNINTFRMVRLSDQEVVLENHDINNHTSVTGDRRTWIMKKS